MAEDGEENPVILLEGLYPIRLNDFLESARGRIWMEEQERKTSEGPEWGPQRWWWLVAYPEGVKLVEWLSAGEADVKARATGRAVQRVRVTVADEEVQG